MASLRPAAMLSICSRRRFPRARWSARRKCVRCRSSTSSSRSSRGLYGGTVGYFGARGDMDQAITIRTLVFRGDEYSYQAGAGIVADSVPEAEHEEVLAKSAAMLRALELAGGRPMKAAAAADRQLRFLHLQPGAGVPGARRGRARVSQRRDHGRGGAGVRALASVHLAGSGHAVRCRRVDGHDPRLRRARCRCSACASGTSPSSKCSAARWCAPAGSCTARPRISRTRRRARCSRACRSRAKSAAITRSSPQPESLPPELEVTARTPEGRDHGRASPRRCRSRACSSIRKAS